MSIFTSVLQGGANNHETTSEEINYHATDFISEGVVGAVTNTSGVAPATGAFAANAQGTPDMTIAISAGVAYVQATPTGGSSQTLRVRNTASANITIASNSSGSTKYDWVYIKVDPDKAKDPNSAASDVATLVVSRSTSSSSDDGTPPTYGYPLAKVTVANGASSITNGNIADIRTVTGASVPDDSITDDKLDFPRWSQELGRTTLSATSDTITISSFTAKKYLKIYYSLLPSGQINPAIRFNNDSAANYSSRFSPNGGGSDTTSTGQTSNFIDTGGGVTVPIYGSIEVVNISSQEKLSWGTSIDVSVAGAGNAPGRRIHWQKWINTSAQISRIDVVNLGSGDFASGSQVIVVGHD
jgi:hypothetical protein